jgi:hypothetical protein
VEEDGRFIFAERAYGHRFWLYIAAVFAHTHKWLGRFGYTGWTYHTLYSSLHQHHDVRVWVSIELARQEAWERNIIIEKREQSVIINPLLAQDHQDSRSTLSLS